MFRSCPLITPKDARSSLPMLAIARAMAALGASIGRLLARCSDTLEKFTASERPAGRMRIALCGAGLALMLAGHGASCSAAAAPPLPAAVAAAAEALAARGGGTMRFLGLSIYDGWYWSVHPGWSLASPFALDLHYHRSLAGASIAGRSADEIEKLGVASPEQVARWGEAMRRIFPDVVKGDRLTGLFLPPATVRYFANGKLIGEIVDPQFARAFFGIWLDPGTSRTDFRQELLGKQ